MRDDGSSERSLQRPGEVRLQWNVMIPMRDGVRLNATLYLPDPQPVAAPVIFTMTPYIAQTYHEYGIYFAARGYPFLCIDVRGRGNSEGTFKPNINEAKDGHDIVEWIARQSFCNGKVAMWGGSYMGYVQWATAKEFPPHLASIVPAAAPYFGVDFPLRNNIAFPYAMQWLMLVAGRTLQDKMFADQSFWNAKFRRWFEAGESFRELDRFLGYPSAVFREWSAHPDLDDYWDEYNPTAEQYSRLSLPILTITGAYDGDQPGALMHYREHVKHRPAAASQHYLVIGPWDHAGTRVPKLEFAGIKVGPGSLIDLPQLHCEWYAWTMQAGPKPAFLKANIAYYVIGADTWRYADTLESLTQRLEPFYLHSWMNPDDVLRSGSLITDRPIEVREPDHYLYDPTDVAVAKIESETDPLNRTDQRLIYGAAGRVLVYHSEPFAKDTEISGFFKLIAWLAIDQPDTDFHAAIYEIDATGASVMLSFDTIRARYRKGLRVAELIQTSEPLCYEFDRFTFIAKRVSAGSRLRLVIGPVHSIQSQKNYNSGGVVADETIRDARPVRVRLYHDVAHPSALYVPYGRTDG